MTTVNEKLQDSTIGHAVDLDKYSNHVVRRIIQTLNSVDSDLAQQLSEALERLPAESFTVQRLESLLKSVKELNAKAFAAVNKELDKELKDFTGYETNFQLKLFKSAIPTQVIAEVGVASVNAGQVYAAAMAKPMQGRLLKTWAAGIESERLVRIKDAINIGYTEGQTTDQIIRRICGTRARAYSDGVLDISRRHVESVVRTAVSHIAASARDDFYGGNTALIKSVGWVSTLDGHTTHQCMIRDTLQYQPVTHKPIGHKIPWLSGPGKLHFCCRSTSVPITKSLRELGLDVDDFKASTRASMDGQVPADMSFGDWLKKQPAARQDELLGPVRGKLMRDGKLSLDRFYSDKGVFLSLAQLKQRGIS